MLKFVKDKTSLISGICFILTSLFFFNILIVINTGFTITFRRIVLYIFFGSVFIFLLYFSFKNLLMVPLPDGTWYRN